MKEYILKGFLPSDLIVKWQDVIFIKLCFHSFEAGNFTLSLDVDCNFKHELSKKINRGDLQDFGHYSISVDNEFPRTWEDLVSLFAPEVEKKVIQLRDYISDLNNQPKEKESVLRSYPLNQILYGPPGTGKTYHTINKALKIIDGNIPEEQEERTEVTKRFKALKEAGQIVFTTFHQSMTYEDFVEGIKPVSDDGEVNYDVQQGIFRQICANASAVGSKSIGKINFNQVDYYKMSVGGRHRKSLHDWNVQNETLSLGYGGKESLEKYIGIKEQKEFRERFTKDHPELVEETNFHATAAYRFLKMKDGDIVVVSLGNHVIDAIGVVRGDYYFDDDHEFPHPHFRKVEWLATDMNASPSRFIKKNLSQQTIYEFYSADVKIDAFEENFNNRPNPVQKPYVLIIDEINRGNVSAILGELITLLEPDKRLGASEELKATLPYSKKELGIPSNLYIIGTMNTADRSVEALDSALRRRFHFEEMPPKYDLPALNKVITGYSLGSLLQTINERIAVLLDRDHLIGHAYLINCTSEKDLENTFQRNIIPLLQEYFYSDYEKIALVLGEGFCKEKEHQVVFAGQKNYSHAGNKQYELLSPTGDVFKEAIKRLMNG
ncbi:AAA family ATPase [Persicobacter diffluens]|uniref:AAA family ATPase n=1 Tax=Persicobacter diffluens TaxID=981 RepID=UPI0030C771F8